MFSKDITGSDAFREMPQSSQALYFHLGMEADDDGFLDSYKGLMRSINASEDDLKILLSKRFLILFPSKIIVVKHWLINNTVRADRYKETKHLDEKKALLIKDNGSYTELGIPNGNQMATQKRIGKDRIEEKSIAAKAAPEVFSLKEEIEKLYTSNRRDLNLIGWYFEKRKPDIRSREQYATSLKRHLRAAKELAPFTDDQLTKAWKYVSEEYPEWTLETLTKKLTK